MVATIPGRFDVDEHSLFDQPRQQPHNEKNWNGEDGAERCCEQKQKRPIAPSMKSRFSKMSAHQQVIAAIRLPCNIEDIAEEGDGAYQDADTDIGGHSNQRHIGNASYPGSQGDDE